MKKKEVFFCFLFAVCFLSCATVLAGNYLQKQLKSNGDIYFVKNSFEETEVSDETKSSEEGQQPWDETKFLEEVQQPWDETKPLEDAGTADKEEKNPGEEAETDVPPEDGVQELPKAAGPEYFEDALFIGDSRTVGLKEYGNIEGATFFAHSGLTTFDLENSKVSVEGMGKVTLDEVLKKKKYGKIYLMLGVNELGYRFESIEKQYQKTVEKLKENQESAIIYLCANLHVTETQSEKDAMFNNENINRVNEMIQGLEDKKTFFYIDVNERFDDENGNLSMEYASDAFHVLGKYYRIWADWLCTKAVSAEK